MPRYPIYQVDSFTNQLFAGNPAAVCVLDDWLADELLESIAAENNLSETAFIVPIEEQKGSFKIRWFTPTDEVDICGHATLAAAYVIFNFIAQGATQLKLESKSGELGVARDGDKIILDFPRWSYAAKPVLPELEEALSVKISELYEAPDWFAIVESEQVLQTIEPNFEALKATPIGGIIVSAVANSDAFDFVYRSFFPNIGIDEDPVTGSSQCGLMPYWAQRLGQSSLVSKQISKRGGVLHSTLTDERVMIAGEAKLYLKGEIQL